MVGRNLGIEEKMKNTLINIIKIAIYLLSMFFIVGFTLVYFYMDRDVRDATIEIYVYDEKHNWISRKIVERNKNNKYIGTKIEKRIISYYE